MSSAVFPPLIRRRRCRSLVFLLIPLLWAAALQVFHLHRLVGPATQSINIRWTPDTEGILRQAAERALKLRDGEEGEPGTWTYRLQDYSKDAIRNIVRHPRVADTNHIDRVNFRVLIDDPSLPMWLRSALSADRGPALALILLTAGLVALGFGCGVHDPAVRMALFASGRVRRTLGYAALTALLQLLITLWVPINLNVISDYLQANLAEAIQPRALIGTAYQYFASTDGEFLLATQLAVFVWLALVVLLIVTPSRRASGAPDWQSCALIFVFGFSTLPFVTNAFSGFVDIFAAAALAGTVWLLYHGDRSSVMRMAGVVGLLCIATLIHDKSVFEVAMLLIWIACTRRPALAVPTVAAYAAFFVGYLALTATAKSAFGDKTFGEYLDVVRESRSFLEHYSLNVAGIALGGGVLWVVYARLAVLFVRARPTATGPLPRLVLVCTLIALCMAPLLVAWDTNRLVAIIWLPTLLLYLELGGPDLWNWHRRTGPVIAAACMAQALMPPVLVYRHRALTLNCYASFVVQHLEQAQRAPSWPVREGIEPLTLRFDAEGAKRISKALCVPMHLVRP